MDSEELQESLEPVIEALSKHKGQLIVLGLVAVAAYAYFFVLPHPGVLTVTVSELDGSGLNDAEVTVMDDATGKTIATDLTSGGSVSFYNVPSRKTLRIEASKGAAFKTRTTTAELPSGQPKAVRIDLERRNSLSFGTSRIPLSMPLGCSDEFAVEVKNSGTDNFDGELLVEGGLEGVLSVPESKKILYYNSTFNFTVRAIVDAEQALGGEEGNAKSGTLRIKKTGVSKAITIRLSPKLQLDVTPAEVPITDAKPRQKITLRVYNGGTQPVTGISFKVNGDSDLRAACNQNIESCISIEQLSADSGREIPAQGAMLVSLIVTPPNEVGKTFLGSLEMSADCLRKSPIVVPIRIEIKG